MQYLVRDHRHGDLATLGEIADINAIRAIRAASAWWRPALAPAGAS
jgi:hypothetical protein